MKRGENRRVRKWLLLCFPYGLYRMWRRDCTWSRIGKGLISAGFVCLILVVLFFPAPHSGAKYAVSITEKEKQVGIYGPEAPSSYDRSQYLVSEGGSDLLAGEIVDNTVYVYASAERKRTYYHVLDCQYAYASRKMTIFEAYTLGYNTPCNLCHPPLLNMQTGEIMDNPGIMTVAQTAQP